MSSLTTVTVLVPLLLVVTALLAFGLALMWARRMARAHLCSVYEAREEGGVEALESLEINGVRHWVHIRGRDRKAPILLFLHGGPGASNIGWFDSLQRPWEDDYIVVQWDQAQAGKSYRSGLAPQMSHDRYVSDAEVMLAHIRTRLGQDKVVLMATSYGTYIGVHLVKKHPEWISAYVAVGQLTNMREHTTRERALLLAEARERGEHDIVTRLEGMAPYPDPEDRARSFADNILFLLDWECRFGKCYPDSLSAIERRTRISQLVSPHYGIKDILRLFVRDSQAIRTPGTPIYETFLDFDLPQELGSRFEVPTFFFTGRHDFHIDGAQSDAWFREIDAPYKEHIWFERSAHAAYITEPYAFARALIERVGPLARNGLNREAADAQGDSND
ncbi:alpha/beta hydrolase [Porticoccaceae bacterium]|nr:alpha/beta hydrolase [Porticoccaceae bacterium]